MSQSKYCSNCGGTIQIGTKFCGRCGQPIQKTAVQPTATLSSKRKGKLPHLIISVILSLMMLAMGITVEEVIARGGGLEDILIIPVLVLLLQISMFYFQTKQKSYYPVLPMIASLWVVITHILGLIALKTFIDVYPGMESSDFAGEIALTIVTIFGFAFLIVVNIVSLFMKGKPSPQTAGKKVS